jgi:hypothetical protein
MGDMSVEYAGHKITGIFSVSGTVYRSLQYHAET